MSDEQSNGQPAVDPQQLLDVVAGHHERLGGLEQRVETLEHGKPLKHGAPADWCWYPPPQILQDPRKTLAAFVKFYNQTYAVNDAPEPNPNPPIPPCWNQHPGLAAELATLAASWREAFTGPAASTARAQQWHDTIRPGFAARLPRWTGSKLTGCEHGLHETTDPGYRPDRWTAANTATESRGDGFGGEDPHP